METPSTMKAWQYSGTKGGLEKNLKINPSAALFKRKDDQHLVQVIATALNPVDYKVAEIPLVGRFAITKPATPGIDFAGRIVTPATGSPLKAGQLVFGVAGNSPVAGGGLAEFSVANDQHVATIPDEVDPIDAATIGVAGLTAYQSIVPNVKEGDKIFINGGSGGTGVFGIQIAKAVGCHVTTSCSTANVELCKSLGADLVLDYKKGSVLEGLKASGNKYNYVVDNVGHDKELYWRGQEYMMPDAVYRLVAGEASFDHVADVFKRKILPGFLGGMKVKMVGFWPQGKAEDFERIGAWVKDGKIRIVIDQKFAFEQAPEAFEKLKTGRAKGKIVVDVASG